MSVLQRITRQVNFAFLRRNLSTTGFVQMIPKNKAESENQEMKREAQEKIRPLRSRSIGSIKGYFQLKSYFQIQ